MCDWRCVQTRLNICQNIMSFTHSSVLGSYIEKLIVLLSWCLCDLHLFSFHSSGATVYSDLFHLSWASLLGRIMKLKNSAVETFKENNMIFTSERNFHSKKMREDYVASPNQAYVQTRCKWIIGDVTEVLDRNTWKLGKILKMLKNNYFVIRLADCIQLKEFHISSLRIPRGLEAPQSKPFHAADKVTVTSWEYKVALFQIYLFMCHTRLIAHNSCKFGT